MLVVAHNVAVVEFVAASVDGCGNTLALRCGLESEHDRLSWRKRKCQSNLVAKRRMGHNLEMSTSARAKKLDMGAKRTVI